jgi:putative Mg2+ transporter-C (MgtC) family protein
MTNSLQDTTMDWLPALQYAALRVGLAVVFGAALGLNRDLHHKGAGLRTFGLVALATASLAIAMSNASVDAQSRIIQGVLTGIGFLGAGVILRQPGHRTPAGLTTSAAIWLTSVLGLLCGFGYLMLATVGFVIAILLLVAGGRLERMVERHFKDSDDNRQ